MSDNCVKRDTISLKEMSRFSIWEITAIVNALEWKRLLRGGKRSVAMRTFSRLLLSIGVSVMLWGTLGCQYYEEFRVKKATADLKEEQAELLHAYRICLEKYQDDPPKAKEICGPYTQRLREIEVTHH